MTERVIDLGVLQAYQQTRRFNAERAEELRSQAKTLEEGEMIRALQEEQEETQKLRDRIRTGESTGDKFLDLVVLRTFPVDLEAAERFSELDARVAESVGQPVLVVVRNERSYGMDRGRPIGQVNETLATGILMRPELEVDLQEASWAFPTDEWFVLPDDIRVAEPDWRPGKLATEEVDRSLVRTDRHFEDCLDQPLHIRMGSSLLRYRGQVPPALEILVGDTEINAWLAKDDAVMGTSWDRRYREKYAQLLEALRYDGATQLRLP